MLRDTEVLRGYVCAIKDLLSAHDDIKNDTEEAVSTLVAALGWRVFEEMEAQTEIALHKEICTLCEPSEEAQIQ